MANGQAIIWRRVDIPGHEYSRITTENLQNIIEGAAILTYEKQFCKLDYKIICDADWQTLSANVSGFVGEKTIEIEVWVDEKKRWTMNGAEISSVENCIDIDLNFSPVTNTLPIRRLNLPVGEKAKVRAAWLRFPSFALEPLEQIYERTAKNAYHYESGGGGKFITGITTDDSGLVIKYPNLWQIEN